MVDLDSVFMAVAEIELGFAGVLDMIAVGFESKRSLDDWMVGVLLGRLLIEDNIDLVSLEIVFRSD